MTREEWPERVEVREAAKRRREERIAHPPKAKKTDTPAVWDDWFKGS